MVNVPKLRFPGFEDEWEEEKLGDIAKINMGQSPKSKWYNNESLGLPLVQGNADISNRKTKPQMHTEKITKIAKSGDLILTVRAPVGYIAKTEEDVCIGRGVCSISSITNNFLYYYLIKNEKKWHRYSQGSTFTAVNSDSINNFAIYTSSIEEQRKIGDFLSTIDDRIENQEKKVESIKGTKKGLMQKIFSQEIRFKNESGEEFPEWEERKLGDITSLKQGYPFKSNSYMDDGNYHIVTISNVSGKRCITNKFNNNINLIPNNIQKHQKLKENDILISMTGNVGRVSLNKGEGNLLNQRVGVFSFIEEGNHNKEFLFQFLSTKTFENKMISKGQGAAQLNISKKDIEAHNINLPTLEEQNKIANLLSTIDEKIEVEEGILESLNDIKKGLLQQMFV